MVLPTTVKVVDKFTSELGEKKGLDVFVSDEELYNINDDRFDEINLSVVRSFFGGDVRIKQKALAFLNTIMIETNANCISSCNVLLKSIRNELTTNDVNLTLTQNVARIIAKYLTELTLSLMIRGVYRVKVLPNNDFVELLEQTLYAPTDAKVEELKIMLRSLYAKDLARYAKSNIAALVRRVLKKNTDVTGTLREYFIAVSDATVMELENMVKGGN